MPWDGANLSWVVSYNVLSSGWGSDTHDAKNQHWKQNPPRRTRVCVVLLVTGETDSWKKIFWMCSAFVTLQRIRSRKPASDAFTVNGVCWTRRSVLTPGQWRLAIKLFILALVQVSRSGARREPGNPREHVNTAFSLPITRWAAHREAKGRPAWLVSGLEHHSP